jgi:hypothetical protein
MKQTNELTIDEMNQIFGVVMDSHLQKELMENSEHENSWMLNYAFDSHLLREVEEHYAKTIKVLELKGKLESTIDSSLTLETESNSDKKNKI